MDVGAVKVAGFGGMIGVRRFAWEGPGFADTGCEEQQLDVRSAIDSMLDLFADQERMNVTTIQSGHLITNRRALLTDGGVTLLTPSHA